MRLLDQVAQAVRPVDVVHPILGKIRLPGAERYSATIREIGSRFVLQPDVTRVCGAMIRTQPELLTDCLDLVRIPSTELWVEWGNACLNPEAERLAGGPGQRAGMLVTTAETGRAGMLRSFWESENGPEVSPGRLHFDLDQVLGPAAGECDKALEPVLAHTRMELDPEWEAYYLDEGPSASSLRQTWTQVRYSLWHDMLVLLGFSLMAGMRSELAMEPAQLDRLNNARRKRRAPELLEFVEVTAGLFGQSPAHRGGGLSTSSRSAARLHHVRGHFVRRGDILFWRRPHLRGEVSLGPAPARVTRLGLNSGSATRFERGTRGRVARTGS